MCVHGVFQAAAVTCENKWEPLGAIHHIAVGSGGSRIFLSGVAQGVPGEAWGWQAGTLKQSVSFITSSTIAPGHGVAFVEGGLVT